MNRPLAPALILLAAALAPAPAAAQSAWTTMDYTDTRHPGRDTPTIDRSWGARDRTEGFGHWVSATVRLQDGRTAFVSIAGSSPECLAAANSAAVETDVAPVCPVKAVVTDRSGRVRVAVGRTCISATLPEDRTYPAGSNETQFELRGTTLAFRAKVEGKFRPDCESTLELPSAE